MSRNTRRITRILGMTGAVVLALGATTACSLSSGSEPASTTSSQEPSGDVLIGALFPSPAPYRGQAGSIGRASS